MEQLLPILIGISIGFGFFYENLKLQKRIKQLRDDIHLNKKFFYRNVLDRRMAMAEAKKHINYRYQSVLWKVDSDELVEELLKRIDDTGQPLFIAHCVSDEFTKNRLVGLIVRKKIVLRS